MAAAHGRCKPLPRDRRSQAQLPRIRRRRLNVPTPLQIRTIAEAISTALYAMVILCATMGLRQGEALALHPQDIDWEGGRIWVHQHVNKETGIREEGTEADAGAWVTMPTRTQAVLRDHIAEFPSDAWVFNSLGVPYTASRVYKAWMAACRRAGVSGVRFHDLRHAAASLMISAGWSTKRVQTEMRHADPAFTLRVYGHLFPDDLERDRALLDQALNKLLPDPAPTEESAA
jgi:integrase